MQPLEDSSGLFIRRARRDDVREIVRMLADDPLGSQRERFQDPLPQTYYDAFEEIDADAHHELVVIEKGGEVVGTLQLTFLPGIARQGGKRAQIEAVHVASGCRGQGIGQALLAWAVDRARQEGCRLVQLTTDKSRRDAHRFYERLGFVSSHEGMKLFLP